MHANDRVDVKEARTGDIVALLGMKDTTTGDTMYASASTSSFSQNDAERGPFLLESIDFPEPVIKIALEPKTKNDQEKMGLALNRLGREDPSFHYFRDAETGQTTISGMGELHLEIIVDRMKREFKVECTVSNISMSNMSTVHIARLQSLQDYPICTFYPCWYTYLQYF